MRVTKIRILIVCLLLFAALTAPALAAGGDLNIDVDQFTLDNGMLFLVVERHTTPQVACRLAIRAGSALEQSGKTGIAHMLEHMMFKGTANFGTRDPEKDRRLQEEIEAAAQLILREEDKRRPDPEVVAAAEEKMARLRREVQQIFVPQAFSSQLGRNGAVGVNAFTTQDQTQFMMAIPSDMLEQWFSIVSEQIFEPSWREFYVERSVIQREWTYRYVNNPGGAAMLDLNATAYVAHPYHNPTIGWPSDMQRFTTTDAAAFHRRYYNPANAVAVLVGDITPEAARRLARTYFGRYPAGERAPERVTAEPPQAGPRERVRYLNGARTPAVRVGFHGAAMGTRDFFALDAISMILNMGRSARLDRDIVNKGLAVSAWAANPDNRYGGMLILGGEPNEPPAMDNRALPENERRRRYLEVCRSLETQLLEQAEAFKKEPVSEADLERIKKLNRYEFLTRLRSNEALAEALATMEVQVGWHYLLEYLDEMAAVTPQEILAAARTYIRRENQTTVFIVPGGAPDEPPQAYAEARSLDTSNAARMPAPTDLRNHSRFPTPEGWKHPLSFKRSPRKIAYPEAVRATAGGVPVYYLPDRELPLVNLTILVKAGEVDVADDKLGLDDLLSGTLIRGGTQLHPPDELALALDGSAIHLSLSVGREDAALNLSAMKSDWPKAIELLTEVLTRPAFDETVLAATRSQLVSAIKRQSDDAQAVSMREAMIWHFKGHPYGRDPLKALDTLGSVGAEDLKGFLKTYFVPANMVASVAGDLSLEEALAGLDTLFDALPATPPPQRRLSDPPATAPVLALVDKPGQAQAQVAMMLPSVKRSDPQYWNIALLMNIFGGSESLLYTRLRDDLGLAYSAGFAESYFWRAGFLVGWIGSKIDMTTAAIEETVSTMTAVGKEVPQDDFRLKQLDALNSFVFNVDTPDQLVDVYARYFMRGEPPDTLERIQDAFFDATPGALSQLAQRFLNPAELQIFVTADKSTPVRVADGKQVTLEQDLEALAERLHLPYREIALR